MRSTEPLEEGRQDAGEKQRRLLLATVLRTSLQLGSIFSQLSSLSVSLRNHFDRSHRSRVPEAGHVAVQNLLGQSIIASNINGVVTARPALFVKALFFLLPSYDGPISIARLFRRHLGNVTSVRLLEKWNLQRSTQPGPDPASGPNRVLSDHVKTHWRD